MKEEYELEERAEAEEGEEEEEEKEEEEEEAAAARQSSVMMADPDGALRRLHIIIITTPPFCLGTTRYANTWRHRCSRTDVSRAAGVSPRTPPTASIVSAPATLAALISRGTFGEVSPSVWWTTTTVTMGATAMMMMTWMAMTATMMSCGGGDNRGNGGGGDQSPWHMWMGRWCLACSWVCSPEKRRGLCVVPRC